MRALRGVVVGVALAACGDAPDRTTTARVERTADSTTTAVDTIAQDSVDVVFTRGEEAVRLRRPGRADSPALRTALEALLAGPTPAERAAGVESWFSKETSGALRGAQVDSAGHAVVDFEDLRAFIPNAASSAGSRLLLVELNGTVFQFPEIESVEYRLEGSCDAFWDWLQYGCHRVTRAEQ